MQNFWDFNVWGTFNVVAVLLVSLLAGCSNQETDDRKLTAQQKIDYMYVSYADNRGFAGYLGDYGMVFVKYKGAYKTIEPMCTVTVRYDRENLILKKGTFADQSGEIKTYQWTLVNPANVHVNDVSKGEVVFG